MMYSFSAIAPNTKELYAIWLLTLSRWRAPSYRNQSNDLQSKSMDWFLYDRTSVMKELNTIWLLNLIDFHLAPWTGKYCYSYMSSWPSLFGIDSFLSTSMKTTPTSQELEYHSCLRGCQSSAIAITICPLSYVMLPGRNHIVNIYC